MAPNRNSEGYEGGERAEIITWMSKSPASVAETAASRLSHDISLLIHLFSSPDFLRKLQIAVVKTTFQNYKLKA